jgi:transposase
LVEGSTATHPGVYCLRTNVLELDDEKLWKTYIMLNDLEAVFRSLKSELGLRPVYHQTEVRCDGHLFITVLAYQCVQVIRNKLGQRGINESWTTIRENLLTHRRSTTTFPQRTGVTVHVRKTYRPETRHLIIYDALNIEHRPGGIYRTRVPE